MSLALTNGAQLSASTFGQGNAGNVRINARDRVTLDGISSDGSSPSGAFSRVESPGVGKGGTIDIIAGSVALTNGAQLNASTDGGGNAGNVTINARDTLELNNSSISTNAVSVGGGDITITTGV
ncbi:MAG: hypothetical protein DSM106950_37520 [Stigonema ocellatum SAG 48.90 = DSM 106950]|nr:hypothetical protein [Stigonema ocellatum SAG 48.90 = DSM 106950]